MTPAEIIAGINLMKAGIKGFLELAKGNQGYSQEEQDQILLAAHETDTAHDDQVAAAKARIAAAGADDNTP